MWVTLLDVSKSLGCNKVVGSPSANSPFMQHRLKFVRQALGREFYRTDFTPDFGR